MAANLGIDIIIPADMLKSLTLLDQPSEPPVSGDNSD